MEKRLGDIYKEIQESLAQKAKVGNKNDDDNDKKHEERNTIMDMFLDPTPIREMVRYSIEDYNSPDKRVKK
ncbi:MAG: hypothetical protein WAK17_23985 [Candidatus Nitrosopolaris sp.]